MVTLTNLEGNFFFQNFSCMHGRSWVYGRHASSVMQTLDASFYYIHVFVKTTRESTTSQPCFHTLI